MRYAATLGRFHDRPGSGRGGEGRVVELVVRSGGEWGGGVGGCCVRVYVPIWLVR